MLLLFFDSLQIFGPDLLLACSVETVVRWLVTPVVHHIDELDREAIKLRFWLQFLQFKVDGLLFLFKMFKTLVFEESLLVIQKFIKITLLHVVVRTF